MPILWGVLLVGWFVFICVAPDPRPLGAPQWAVETIQSLIGLSEPGARAVATIGLRAIGISLLGVLLALTFSRIRLPIAVPAILVGAGLLAIASQWINYGYFPIRMQIQLGLASSIAGSLFGLVLRKSLTALVVLAIFLAGLFFWGTSTGISDDLFELARATGRHVLEHAGEISDGDEGFVELLQLTFAFAEDNSHQADAIEPSKAAILALGTILGEERVAQVAKRKIDVGRSNEIKALYRRITLRGRNDLARHFWVSAALAVLSDESRSMDVGIAKELMDATAGGSGFSFVDLTADRAGTLFATAATRDSKSARSLQVTIQKGVVTSDFFPEVEGLPEGLTRDVFQEEYGGLGGAKTNEIVEEIQRRLNECPILAIGE